MILFDVYVRDTIIDEWGPCKDVAIYWTQARPLVVGEIDPYGVETIVECMSGDVEEIIRDKIRDGVIALMEADYGFNDLTRDMVRVDGMSNDTTIEHSGVGANPPTVWYQGPMFVVRYPAYVTTSKPERRVRQDQVTTQVIFNDNLNPDQRPHFMSAHLQFDKKNYPRNISALDYFMEAWDTNTNVMVWSKEFDLWNSIQSSYIMSIVDLSDVAQQPLWDAEIVEFRLTVGRNALLSKTLSVLAGGCIHSASISFVWE